jgi:flagellar M-ring protein FliF
VTQALLPMNDLQLPALWSQLSVNRKIGLGVLVAAAVAAAVLFATWSQTPDYVAAFTDLKPEDGAAILDYLKENNISYQISDNGTTIKVPGAQVHEVRLALASKGLPGKGTVGFELFDNAPLGMTDFTQQVNYQRALEGELARTIASLTAVQSARVHIVIPQPTLFTEEEKPSTASVVVDLKPGQKLTAGQVQAISHLVSSAVEGLTPENLTIVDMEGNVLADGSASAVAGGVTYTQSQMDAQRAYERDLEQRLQTMLDNVLGPDKAVVRVAAQMNWDQVKTEKETYLPAEQGSVIRSARQTTETYLGEGANVGGVPGVPSNVPDEAAPSYQTIPLDQLGKNGYQHADLITNYEVSRAVSHIISATGTVERLSVSILVNDITDPTQLDTIQRAAVAAIGIDQARGDVLTVTSIPFDRTFYAEQQAAMEETQQREFYFQIARWGAIALVLIALFFIVFRTQRSLRMRPVEIVEEPDARLALLEEMARMRAQDEYEVPEDADMEMVSIGPPTFSEEQRAAVEKAQMLRQLQLMSKNRPENLAQIIQFWLSEEGNR